MRAAIVEKIGSVIIKDMPKPSPGDEEVLVKISAAGVCHSDLHLMRGDWVEVPTPFPLGHEGIGIVEELGPNSKTNLKKGDRVILGLGDLLADPVSEKFLKSLPGMATMIDSPQAQMAMGMSLTQIQGYAESMTPGQFTKEMLDQINEGLKAL
ncbi:unnamed protein product [marine sediment metagenome]|uniref:Alcohol dehydrogenase-like N-terminal domain-containing protein n=1 Tax=marine sediment metagenome TaxID=412755 RepID=X1C2S4_9ZZZZ